MVVVDEEDVDEDAGELEDAEEEGGVVITDVLEVEEIELLGITETEEVVKLTEAEEVVWELERPDWELVSLWDWSDLAYE